MLVIRASSVRRGALRNKLYSTWTLRTVREKLEAMRASGGLAELAGVDEWEVPVHSGERQEPSHLATAFHDPEVEAVLSRAGIGRKDCSQTDRVQKFDVPEINDNLAELVLERSQRPLDRIGGRQVQFPYRSHSGGGWFGGGFGPQGAVEGAAMASVLNALSTRHRKYTLLVAASADPVEKQARSLGIGAPAYVALGFRKMDLSVLQETLLEAIPRWIEPFVVKTSEELRENRDLIHPDEAARRLLAVREMQDRRLLTDQQAERLIQILVEIAPPGPVPQEPHPGGDRISKLKTLADLRESGALTEAEFEAEKQRLISQ